MDIKELDKKQLILLTLLITFVVSIATGIVTVSLMNQMPKSVPQTINNVIQKTIERVTTVETPVKEEDTNIDKTKETASLLGDGDVIVSIYMIDSVVSATVEEDTTQTTNEQTSADDTQNVVSTSEVKELGQGIIISDIGLVLVDSSILNESQVYKVVLNKIDFDATIVKKFDNGFTILKISEKKKDTISPENTDTTKPIQ